MAEIPPLNSCCYVNKAGAAALSAPKCQQAGPLLQMDEFSQCHESRSQGGTPVGRSHPGASDLPSLGTAALRLSAPWEMHCTQDHTPCLQLMFPSLSLFWWQSWKLWCCRLVLTPGKADICLTSMVSVQLCLLAGSSIQTFLKSTHYSSTTHPPAMEGGSWQEEKLPQEALPDRVVMVLTSVLITKEGKGHTAFHASIPLCPSW